MSVFAMFFERPFLLAMETLDGVEKSKGFSCLWSKRSGVTFFQRGIPPSFLFSLIEQKCLLFFSSRGKSAVIHLFPLDFESSPSSIALLFLGQLCTIATFNNIHGH